MIILIGSLRFSIVSSKVLLSRYHVKKLYLLARLKVRFFFQYCSIRTIFYRFQLLPIIVVQLGKEKEPGKSSDEKYIKVTRKYEDRLALNFEFSNNNEQRKNLSCLR